MSDMNMKEQTQNDGFSYGKLTDGSILIEPKWASVAEWRLDNAAKLTAQRDELLAALKPFADWPSWYWQTGLVNHASGNAYKNAQAAIANAERSAK